MAKKSVVVDYNFRADDNTKTSVIKRHLKLLRSTAPSLFNHIKIGKLKHDPEAVNILTAACETVTDIVEKADNNPSPYLYTALGENHCVPAHRIYQTLVISGLIAAGYNVSVGIEASEDNALQEFRKQATNHLPKKAIRENNKKIKRKLKKAFNDNKLSLNTTFTLFSSKNAPYSQKIFDHFLIMAQRKYDNLKVRLTDAPIKFNERSEQTHYLNEKSPDIASQCNGNAFIDAKLHRGKHIRNQHMVTSIPKAKIIIQIAGNKHISDISNPELKNSETLIACALDQGFTNVCGYIMPCNKKDEKKHKDLAKSTPDNHSVKIIPPITNLCIMHKEFLTLEDITKHRKEIEWVNERMKSLAMSSLVKEDLKTLQEPYLNEMVSAITEVTREYMP